MTLGKALELQASRLRAGLTLYHQQTIGAMITAYSESMATSMI